MLNITKCGEEFPSGGGAELSRAAQVVGNVAGGNGEEILSKVRQTRQETVLQKV